MSTYVDKAINLKSGKSQLALFIDDYYGSHRYGVGFKNDGTDANLYDMKNIDSEYTIYPLEEMSIDQVKNLDEMSGL
jgi:hypothetical protein